MTIHSHSVKISTLSKPQGGELSGALNAFNEEDGDEEEGGGDPDHGLITEAEILSVELVDEEAHDDASGDLDGGFAGLPNAHFGGGLFSVGEDI